MKSPSLGPRLDPSRPLSISPDLKRKIRVSSGTDSTHSSTSSPSDVEQTPTSYPAGRRDRERDSVSQGAGADSPTDATKRALSSRSEDRLRHTDASKDIENDDDDEEDVDSENEDEDGEKEGKGAGRDEVSLGHLLTNVIILQEFMLELAALVEVRATLFGEVRYF